MSEDLSKRCCAFSFSSFLNSPHLAAADDGRMFSPSFWSWVDAPVITVE